MRIHHLFHSISANGKRLLPALILLAIVSGPTASHAVDVRIAVTVNGVAITNYDIQQRTSLLRLIGLRGALKNQALNELIDDSLKIQEGQRLGITATSQEVDQAVARIASNVKLQPRQLAGVLAKQGVGIKTLRSRLHSQLVWSKIVQTRFQSGAGVSEQDVTAALAAQGAIESEMKTKEYDLKQVIVVAPIKGGKKARDAARKKAKAILKSFTGCATGLASLRRQKGVVIKPLGIKTEAELTPQYKKAVEQVGSDGLAGPFEMPLGVEMVAVCDQREIVSSEQIRQEIRRELSEEEGKIMTRRYLRDLRRRALIDRR